MSLNSLVQTIVVIKTRIHSIHKKEKKITTDAGRVFPEGLSSILRLFMNRLEISNASLCRLWSWTCL